MKIPESYLYYELNLNEKIRYLILSGLGLMAIAYLFYHSIILSLVFSCVSYLGLSRYRSYLAEKRRKQIKEQFRDVLYSISASVSTGRQMPEALLEAEQSMKLIYKENSLIVLELNNMVKRLNEYREPEEEILKDFALRTGIEDISDFVDIYLTCRETGGDFIRVLTKASEIIMDKITIEKEIRTITAQKQFEAKILTAIPLIILFFLQLVSPDYLSEMYDGIKGRILMTLALSSLGFAYFWSMKLTKIEV
ncbi:MAG TPA: type II secretion system F family protein [Anaerovoracaceae bacterium]|nr:type II secretion system F family protein [Anaerovoracaceae bacterium]